MRTSYQHIFEPIESRIQLSGTIELDGGILQIHAGAQDASTIIVGITQDKAHITASLLSSGGSLTRTFSRSAVQGVNIVGSNKADIINVNQSITPFSAPITIHARNGDDRINTGRENDLVFGGNGDDVINVYAGDDTVVAGNGDDTVTGGDGNDVLSAGNGDDNFSGDKGDDTLDDRHGNNLVFGSAGRDTFILKSLNKNGANDFNPNDDHLKIPGQGKHGA